MNLEFLSTFQPKLLEVNERGREGYWHFREYVLERDQTNNDHNLVLVHEGQGTLEINENHYPLRRGALFYIPKGSSLRIVSSKVHSLKFFSIFFTYGQLHWEGEKGKWKDTVDPRFPIDEFLMMDDKPKVLEAFYLLVDIWESKKAGYEWYSRLEFIRLVDVIMQAVDEASPQAQQTAILIESTLTYIRNHLQEDLNRTALASRFFLTSAYFASLFKKHVGVSLTEFVTSLRMEEARKLLNETNLPIRDIAAKVGYTDSFYFTRNFKKQNGMAPRQFRKL